jgi:hypothetical protein
MPSVLDDPTERVRRHREKAKKAGGAVIGGLTLQPGDDAKMWNRLVLDHGGPKPALVYLLRQEMGRGTEGLSDAELLAMLASRLRQAGSEPPAPAPAKKTGRKSIRPEPISGE